MDPTASSPSPDLFDALSDPLWTVAPDGRTLRANRAALALAKECGVELSLGALFGDGSDGVRMEAHRSGRAQSFLPLSAGDGHHRIFRTSLSGTSDPGVVLVQLVDVTDEIEWREQLFSRNLVLTVLNDIGAALSATVEFEALAERIYEQTSRIMRTTNFYMALLDRGTGTVSFPIYVHEKLKSELPSRRGANGMTEYVLRTARPLLLNGEVDARAKEMGMEPIGVPSRSWLGVPILADGEAFGVITLQDLHEEDGFDTHDLEVLTIIAGQAAAAIKNAQLFAAARQAFRELSETQARLLESERLRGVTETVGALNHEVNNPLAAIAGNAQLLLRNAEALGPHATSKVEIILDAARRIQRVTGKMNSLIQTSSMPYPGSSGILDVHHSVASGESCALPGANELPPDLLDSTAA